MAGLSDETMLFSDFQLVTGLLKASSRTFDQIEHEVVGERPMNGSVTMDRQQQDCAGLSDPS